MKSEQILFKSGKGKWNIIGDQSFYDFLWIKLTHPKTCGQSGDDWIDTRKHVLLTNVSGVLKFRRVKESIPHAMSQAFLLD